MGRSQSKEKAPNNPFEAELDKNKREQKQKKEIQKKKKLDEKRKRKLEKQSKLDKLKQPTAPVVPRIHTDYETQAKDRMKYQLENDSETFLLNQLMLSIQFFGNYEREMIEAVDRNRKRENEETTKIAQHSKNVVLPDRIHEAIDRRVKFQPRHGPKKHSLASLHTQTLYIVHDNIEITHPCETTLYSIITDAPVYKFEIELPQLQGRRRSLNYHAGYFKLRSLEPIKMQNSANMITDETKYSCEKSQYIPRNKDQINDIHEYEDIDSEISRPQIPARPNFRDSIVLNTKSKIGAKKPIGFLNGVPLSTTSTSSTSPASSEYDYAYITALNTHQPLSVMRSSVCSDKILSAVALPDNCITNVIEPIYISQNEYSSANGDSSASSSESDNEIYVDGERENFENIQCSLEERQYLNSKAFLAYFINLFQDELANNLGFTKTDIEQATWKGSIIYIPQWEIVPAIWCPWPKEASIGFESNPKNKMKLHWPTPAMKQKIRTLGCHVVPIGFTPKLGSNPQRELEWKIVFPEAERYLESCLTNAQTKIYMVTKTLIKAFIDPQLEDRFNMFTIEQIRTHLFWECENNYTAWPDEHLGESLIRFLNSFLTRIKTHNLPDYFLKRRNLFDNIPERLLAELHKRIYRITENPVMYLMIAFRSLKYSKDFYPKLKYRRLYSTLVVDDPFKIINPQFITEEEKNIHVTDDSEVAFGSMAYYERKERHSRRRRTKIVRFMEAEKAKKEIVETRRASVESIDIKLKIHKCLDEMRRKIILEMFFRHFIQMAKIAYQYRAYRLTVSFIKHAERVLNVMQDEHFDIEDAVEVNTDMDTMRISAMTAIANENIEPPELPRRESIADGKGTKSKHKKKDQKSLKITLNRYTNVDSAIPFSPVSFDDESNHDAKKFIPTPQTPTIEEESYFDKSTTILTNVMIHQAASIKKQINQTADLSSFLDNVTIDMQDAAETTEINSMNISLDELLGNVKSIKDKTQSSKSISNSSSMQEVSTTVV